MSPSTEPDPSHSNVFSLQAYLRQLQFLHQPVLSLHNTSLRIMHYRDNPPNTSLSVGLSPGNIQRFLRSPMQSTSRNLWFRLMHNKVSSLADIVHILKLPDDRCPFCGLQQTTSHLLFTCSSTTRYLDQFPQLILPLTTTNSSGYTVPRRYLSKCFSLPASRLLS
jgi:hypothetical protein